MNAPQTWNTSPRSITLNHLFAIGASAAQAQELAGRPWQALSLWAKRGMKRLYKKLEEEAARSARNTVVSSDPGAPSGDHTAEVHAHRDSNGLLKVDKVKRSRPKSKKRRIVKKGKK